MVFKWPDLGNSAVLVMNWHDYWKHRFWFAAFLISSVMAFGWYLFLWNQSARPPSANSPTGLLYGIAGAVIILLEMLIWVRKWRWARNLGTRIRVWMRKWRWVPMVRFGRMRWWMAAHIWLGIISVPLLLMHAGISWGGHLTTLLMWVYLIVIFSGCYGLWLQNGLPSAMKTQTEAETVFNQIRHVSQQNSDSARALVRVICEPTDDVSTSVAKHGAVQRVNLPGQAGAISTSRTVVIGAERSWSNMKKRGIDAEIPRTHVPGSEALWVAFQEDIDPYLRSGRVRREYLRLADKQQATKYFNQLRERLSQQVHQTVDVLERWCDHRRQFDLQCRFHRRLHSWLSIHLPLSIALVVLLFTHILTALRFR